MDIYTAFEKIAELLSRAEPGKLEDLQASPGMQARFEQLVARSRSGEISASEKEELDHYVVLERLVRLAKIRARARGVRRA